MSLGIFPVEDCSFRQCKGRRPVSAVVLSERTTRNDIYSEAAFMTGFERNSDIVFASACES